MSAEVSLSSASVVPPTRPEEGAELLRQVDEAAKELGRSVFQPLNVVDYLRSRGIEDAFLAKLAPVFGRAVAEKYRATYGADPIFTEKYVEEAGAYRPVAFYLLADRPLFDHAFDDLAKGASGALQRPRIVKRHGRWLVIWRDGTATVVASHEAALMAVAAGRFEEAR